MNLWNLLLGTEYLHVDNRNIVQQGVLSKPDFKRKLSYKNSCSISKGFDFFGRMD